LLHFVTTGYTVEKISGIPQRTIPTIKQRLFEIPLLIIKAEQETIMSKTLIITMCIVALLLVSGVAIARYKGLCNSPDARISWMANRIEKHLDLNESQRTQLDILRAEVTSIAETLHSDRSAYVDETVELLSHPTLDRERAHQLLMQKQAQLASVSSDFINAFANFSDNLEQKQRDKLQEMILNHRKHRYCGFNCNANNSVEPSVR
jgi:Spy/CpxP family protein refolding chaperone